MAPAENPLVLLAWQHGLLPQGTGWPASGADRTALGRSVAAEYGLTWIELGEQAIAREILAALPRKFIH